ncbi:bifunctional diguanylate cyclase/phosphodiesterase [Aquipuribacter hungaricus]|uniref:EAL domain-containing protein n=1 Tax=Aquipuribacter hungaricus TaxID=545624 RepID=A0ABV7WH08_9MICO
MSSQPWPAPTGPTSRRCLDPASVAAACDRLRAAAAEDVLDEMCEAVRSLLDGDRAAVGVADGHELVLVASRSRSADQAAVRDVGSRLPVEGSVAGLVLASGQPHVVHDTQQHTRGRFVLNAVEQIRSSVVVPLQRRGAVLTVVSSVPGAMDEASREVAQVLLRAAGDGTDRLRTAVDVATARFRADGEELYRAVLESLGEGVVVHGNRGQVLVHNEAAPRLLGLTPDELVGRAVSDARWQMLEPDGRRIPPEEYPAARALRTGLPERGRTLLLRRPDGEERVMSVTTLPRRGAGDDVFSVVVSFADVTDAHRLAEQAQVQARRLDAAMQLAQLATWETTLGTDDWTFSDLLHHVTGQPPGAEVSDAAVRAWFGPAYPRLLEEWGHVLRDHQPRQVTTEIALPGGGSRTVSVWLDLTLDEDGVPVRQWGVVQDVTERVTALRHLQENEEMFRLAFDEAPIGMVLLDVEGRGRVLRSNAAFRTMIGRGGDDTTDPLTIADWTPPEELEQDMAVGLAFVESDRGHNTIERAFVRADGSTVDVLVTASMARDVHGRPLHVLAHVVDVSERVAHARELEHLALTDGLTGLANRRRMEDQLALALSRSHGRHGLVGLVLLDLDHFKVVNDSLGHGAGDALLVDVAARLRSAVSPGTMVARLGGDEFVAVVTGATTAAEVHEAADRLLASLRRRFDLGGTAVVASASLGVAVSDRAATASELLRHADLALYRAKETGRDRVVAFDAELRTRADERLATEAMLREALDEGGLRLFLQPVVELAGSGVVGAEALVRLQHPHRGLLLPGAFMDVAEETGLVTCLDAWVLDEAVAGLARRPGTRVAVNVSARTLEEGTLVDRVADVLGRHGVEASRLGIELTETSLLTRVAGVAQDVGGLRALGCRVGLDDFGTGYSALSHLQAFELDFLKIDRSFICELGRGSRQDAVVTAVVALAHANDLYVVAEGVETEEQRRLLLRSGCDQAQGWLFGRPAPPA